MTTTTATPTPVSGPVTLAGRTTLPRSVASEWTKFRSLLVLVDPGRLRPFTVGLGVLVSAEAGSDGGPGADEPRAPGVDDPGSGPQVAQLATVCSASC